MQLTALKECWLRSWIFQGTGQWSRGRIELQTALQYLRDGDCLVVYKLDRLGRSMKDLLAIIEQLQTKNVSLISLEDNIDTCSTTGKLVMHIFAALAEFERDLIVKGLETG